MKFNFFGFGKKVQPIRNPKNDADFLMISCYSPEAIIRVRDKSAGFSIRCLKK